MQRSDEKTFYCYCFIALSGRRYKYEGELEQISTFVKDIKPAGQIVIDVWYEFLDAKKKLCEKF